VKKMALALALLLSGEWSAADRAREAKGSAKRVRGQVVPHEPRALVRTPQLLGTITYDTGVNIGFHPDALGGNLNRTVGNRFNSALGGPLLMTGMVSRLTVFPAHDGDQSVSIAGTPTTMNTAMVLVFLNVPMMANQFNAVALTPNVTVGPDFLGIFLGAFGTYQAAGLLGMSDGEFMGQGFHAFQAFYANTGAAGRQTMIEALPNRNAMLRATVEVLVPVELMEFRIQ
jgi:hypothetical protein